MCRLLIVLILLTGCASKKKVSKLEHSVSRDSVTLEVVKIDSVKHRDYVDKSKVLTEVKERTEKTRKGSERVVEVPEVKDFEFSDSTGFALMLKLDTLSGALTIKVRESDIKEVTERQSTTTENRDINESQKEQNKVEKKKQVAVKDDEFIETKEVDKKSWSLWWLGVLVIVGLAIWIVIKRVF